MGVTPPHLRTSYNLFFLEEGCIGSWKRMVVSLSSLYVVLKKRICMCAQVKFESRFCAIKLNMFS